MKSDAETDTPMYAVLHCYLYSEENSASDDPVVLSLTPQWATRC